MSKRAPLVLVVDDFADGRELAAELLEFSGYTTAQACDGEEALELVRRLRPDLVILDIGLPRMDGFAVAGHVRSDPRTWAIPIVAITGHATGDVLERALSAGCDRALVKPCEPDQLLRAVRELLAGASERDARGQRGQSASSCA